MAKKKRTKSYNPSAALTHSRDEFYKQAWFSGSSIHAIPTLHTEKRLKGSPLPLPSSLLSQWVADLNAREWKWRFVVFLFDTVNEDYETIEATVSSLSSSKDLPILMKETLDSVLADDALANAWGWIAVPSMRADIKELKEKALDYFLEQDIINPALQRV